MEFLLQQKEAFTKTKLTKQFNAVKIESLSNENNSNLREFLEFLNDKKHGRKKLIQQHSNQLKISKAMKTDKKITLVMHDKEFIQQKLSGYKEYLNLIIPTSSIMTRK